jgi:alginate O-acetyltransferase complex protein AlgI
VLFNTPLFFLFFLIFILFYGFVFLRQTPKLYFLLVSSLVFYGAWNYKFIPLLVGSAVIDYYLALAIAAAATRRRKKQFLTLSIIMNLGILAIFKYADFAIESVGELMAVFGYNANVSTLSWVLPVGISFYTFQSMSYTIDVYRGDMKARKGLLAFTTALAFFPQLVAGPILRARQILPQFHAIPTPTWINAKHGFLLIVVGWFKKTIADLLAIPAAAVFDSGAQLSLLETWTGVLAFAGQIYGDFSGYTDMAIGLALLLGFKIPLNFRLPYFAMSPVDFWRRWHISLSSWLRDYLYIPLGGNRNNRRLVNIFITMLLGGLWHGAAWTFVAWGAFHGAIITATHYLSERKALMGFSQSSSRWVKLMQWAMTFYLVLISWVLFRANSMDSAWTIMADMHSFNVLPESGPTALLIFAVTALAILIMHLVDLFVIKRAEKFENNRWLFWPVLVLFTIICLLIGEPSSEFIYFQF